MDSTQAAKSIAVPAAFMLAGYYTCSSQNPVAILIDQPASVSTAIFARIYARGTAMVVPGTVAATTAFAYLAYAAGTDVRRRSYATCAVLTLGVIPWTTVVMMGGIKRLLEISTDSAKQTKADSTLEVTQLLKKWMAQNYVRAGMTFAAGVLGLSTLLATS